MHGFVKCCNEEFISKHFSNVGIAQIHISCLIFWEDLVFFFHPNDLKSMSATSLNVNDLINKPWSPTDIEDKYFLDSKIQIISCELSKD